MIEHELQPGEKLLWQGKPRQRLIIDPFKALLTILGALFSATFFTYIFNNFINTHQIKLYGKFYESYEVIFSALLALAVIKLVFNMLIIDTIIRAKTSYAITNQRLVTAFTLFIKQIKTLNIDAVGEITVKEKPDHSGDMLFDEPVIIFGRKIPPGFNFNRKVDSGFRRIENVKQVEAIYRQARKSSMN